MINKERKRYRRQRPRERLVEVGQVGLKQVGGAGRWHAAGNRAPTKAWRQEAGRNGRAEQFRQMRLETGRWLYWWILGS